MYTDTSVHDVVIQMDFVIRKALMLDATHTGGYFCLSDMRGMPLLIIAVGEIDDKKADGCLKYAQEKCRRLVCSNGLLASNTRDVLSGQYAGAVKGVNHIYSFSGLPEYLDEAAMIILAVRLGELDLTVAKNLADKSQNSFFKMLLKKSSAGGAYEAYKKTLFQ